MIQVKSKQAKFPLTLLPFSHTQTITIAVNKPRGFLVRWKLSDMLHHPLDNLGVAFSERGHEAGDLSIVLRVDVSTGRVEKLNNFQMSTVGG